MGVDEFATHVGVSSDIVKQWEDGTTDIPWIDIRDSIVIDSQPTGWVLWGIIGDPNVPCMVYRGDRNGQSYFA